MTEKTDLVRHQPTQRSWDLMPGSFGEAMEIAQVIARSDFAPKAYAGKPESVMLAIQMGADVGFHPMQALTSIAVINNRPSLWGDGALAIAMPVLEDFEETFEGDPATDDYTAVCKARRKGWATPTIRSFSIADARRAGLWGKQGPWTNYPKRMLQMRARGFTLRDAAADRLMGLVLAEEAMDTVIDVTPITATEPQDPPVRAVMATLPEPTIETLNKAFDALNFNVAQRLVKCNEFFMAEGAVPEDAATLLLEWCRDEFAKRKTGQPRAKSSNNKSSRKAADPPVESRGPVVESEAAAGTAPTGAGTPTGDSGVGSGTVADSPLKAAKPQEPELF